MYRTSLRFHPFETVFRATLEAAIVFTLGLPPEGILLSFGILVFFNTLTHMNVALPAPLDRVISKVFVTPHIHKLHHSTTPEHQYTNFGTVFTLWDRLWGTFCKSQALRKDEAFGVGGVEALDHESFANLALDPFRKPKGAAIPLPAASVDTMENQAASANH